MLIENKAVIASGLLSKKVDGYEGVVSYYFKAKLFLKGKETPVDHSINIGSSASFKDETGKYVSLQEIIQPNLSCYLVIEGEDKFYSIGKTPINRADVKTSY